jgi:hypothetical protein
VNWPTWLAFVTLLVIAALIALWIIRRDVSWRRVRVGLFLERERFDEEPLERGWDEDDTQEIELPRYRRTLPEEEK